MLKKLYSYGMTREMCGVRSMEVGASEKSNNVIGSCSFFFFFIIILGSTASWFVLKWTSVTPTELILVKLLYAVHFK